MYVTAFPPAYEQFGCPVVVSHDAALRVLVDNLAFDCLVVPLRFVRVPSSNHGLDVSLEGSYEQCCAVLNIGKFRFPDPELLSPLLYVGPTVVFRLLNWLHPVMMWCRCVHRLRVGRSLRHGVCHELKQLVRIG